METMTSPAASVEALQRQWLRQYDRSINRDLSMQNARQLMLRNLLPALDGLLTDINTRLSSGEWGDMNREELKRLLDGLSEQFLSAVITRHRSSCALSNFPEEHNPQGEYLEQIILATETRWAEFWQRL
ncbi:MAG: hypothetical protein ACPGYX_05230 [Oceanobacter sp.]